MLNNRLSNIPKIILDVNPKEELDDFYAVLHTQEMPGLRERVLTHPYFRDLKNSLESAKINSENEEKQIIWNFLSRAHQRDGDKISQFLDSARQKIEEKSPGALVALAKLMDYEWPDNHPNIRAVPTLLPFSPFGNNVFDFSVLGAAQGNDQKSLLGIAIHEISHMILFSIIEKYHPEIPADDLHEARSIAIFYLKEILAPVLMNQPSLIKFLDPHDYPEGYLGNPDLEEIYIREETGQEKIQITKYFQALYEKMRYQEHKSFLEILDAMLKLIQPMENELAKRQKMWNEDGWDIFDDPKVNKPYAEPIRISKTQV